MIITASSEKGEEVGRRRELTTAGSPRIFSDPAGSCLWTTLRKGDRTRKGETRDRRQESPIVDAQRSPCRGGTVEMSEPSSGFLFPKRVAVLTGIRIQEDNPADGFASQDP